MASSSVPSISAESTSTTGETPQLMDLGGPFQADGPAKDLFNKVMLGSEVDENPDSTDGVNCSDCGGNFPPADMQCITAVKKGKKAVFRCSSCNSCRSRMNRLLKRRGDLAVDWSSVDHDQKKDFITRCGALRDEELADGMSACITLHKETNSKTSASADGAYVPLSCYAALGYSVDHLAAIEKTAPKKWDACIQDFVYQKLVESTGTCDAEIVSNKTVYEPKRQQEAKQDLPASKKAKTTDEKKLEDVKKREEKKKQDDDKKAEKAAKALATKCVGLLAPVLTTGTDLVRMKAGKVVAKIPAFIMDECTLHLRYLEYAKKEWDCVLQGFPVPPDADLELKNVGERVKEAKKSFDKLEAMIKLAL